MDGASAPEATGLVWRRCQRTVVNSKVASEHQATCQMPIIGLPTYTLDWHVPVHSGTPLEKLFTPEQLAEKIGLAVQTIYNRRSNGYSLPPSVRVGRAVRYRPSDVEAWIAGEESAFCAVSTAQPRSPADTSEAKPIKKGRPTKKQAVERRLLTMRRH